MASSNELQPREVVNALQSLTHDQTKELFFQLGVKVPVLENIELEHRGNMRKIHMVQEWLNNSADPSWGSMVAGLREIGQSKLAERIAADHDIPTLSSDHQSACATSTHREGMDGSNYEVLHALHELKQSLETLKIGTPPKDYFPPPKVRRNFSFSSDPSSPPREHYSSRRYSAHRERHSSGWTSPGQRSLPGDYRYTHPISSPGQRSYAYRSTHTSPAEERCYSQPSSVLAAHSSSHWIVEEPDGFSHPGSSPWSSGEHVNWDLPGEGHSATHLSSSPAEHRSLHSREQDSEYSFPRERRSSSFSYGLPREHKLPHRHSNTVVDEIDASSSPFVTARSQGTSTTNAFSTVSSSRDTQHRQLMARIHALEVENAVLREKVSSLETTTDSSENFQNFDVTESKAMQLRNTLQKMEGSDAIDGVKRIEEVYTEARDTAELLVRLIRRANCLSRTLRAASVARQASARSSTSPQLMQLAAAKIQTLV